MNKIDVLLHISKKAGLFGEMNSSTIKLSQELETSQQTVSRKLREMEKEKLIAKVSSTDGTRISISDKGRDKLESYYNVLKKIFKNNNSLKGELVKGLNEGKYYVGLKQYKKQFKDRLGLNPFEGTLNLKVDKVELKRFLMGIRPVLVDGFSTNQRSYGSIKCYKVKINNIDAAIIFPERSLHSEDVIEVIADFNLRKRVGLKDRDKVEIRR